jgi:hypothetical protein
MAKELNKIPLRASVKGSAVISYHGDNDHPKAAKKSTKLTGTETDGIESNEKWALWGEDNLYPKKVMEDLRKSSVGKKAIGALVDVHIGTGPIYFTKRYETTESGIKKLILDRPAIPEIDDFLEDNDVIVQQKGIISDLETFAMAYPEFILNKGKAKVVSYHRNKAIYSRMGKRDKTGKAKHIYVSAKWPDPAKSEYTEIPIYSRLAENLPAKFALPLAYVNSDSGTDYSIPDWDSVRQNGWLDVAEMIPAAKKAIYQNQAVIKYHVRVPANYFSLNCAGWDEMSAVDQQKEKDALEDAIEQYLTDVKNYGKSIFTYDMVDDMGKKISGVEITAIDNKLKDGQFLPDATAANAEILFAIGINPSIIGVGIPGTRASKGSGSYIREELWKMQALAHSNRVISLKPLRLITKINKWTGPNGEKLHWMYGDISSLKTLDENPEGVEHTLKGAE